MADILIAGAGLLAVGYLVAKNPGSRDGAHRDMIDMPDEMMGIVKPTRAAAYASSKTGERIASDAPDEIHRSGPDAPPVVGHAFLDDRLKSLHARNALESMSQTTRLFDPYRFGRYRESGTAPPLVAAFMTADASMVPYETAMDYSPYVLRGWGPIEETSRVDDLGPHGHRPEDPAEKLDFETSSTVFVPHRAGNHRAMTATYAIPRSVRVDMNDQIATY